LLVYFFCICRLNNAGLTLVVSQMRAFAKLNAIDAAIHLKDLRLPPSNRFEALKGEHKGQYSIRINDRWRICFEWRSGNAEQVEIVDYH